MGWKSFKKTGMKLIYSLHSKLHTNKLNNFRLAPKFYLIYFLSKPSAYSTVLDNFYPVSNLPVLGKIVEKVIHTASSANPR